MTDVAPAWVLPGEPLPVRYMNTIWADAAQVHDDLTNAAALRDWVALVNGDEPGSPGDPDAEELAEAVALRDALRRLAAFVTDDSRSTAQSRIDTVDVAVEAVNDAVAHRPRTTLTVHGGALERDCPQRASPTRTALAELAHQAIDLLTGPTATKLRACHAPHCVLYFVKTHPRREWCSEACGNRVRAARHYRRTRSQRRVDSSASDPPWN